MYEAFPAAGAPGGEEPRAVLRPKAAKNILVRSRLPGGGYAANPYTGCEHACRYCYAAFMDRYAGRPEPWGRYVDVKTWEKLGAVRLEGKQVFLSSVTDPYQPAEARCGRTRALLEELKGTGCRLSVLTKSDLVLRDLDLIREFPNAVVAWSVNTLDEEFRADMDRGAPIGRRLEAMRMFHDSGVHTACFIAPIFPCITDLPALFGALRGIADEIWLDGLNLRGPNRDAVLDYIERRWPGFLPVYQAFALGGDRTCWAGISDEIAALAEEHPARVVSFLKEDRPAASSAGT